MWLGTKLQDINNPCSWQDLLVSKPWHPKLNDLRCEFISLGMLLQIKLVLAINLFRRVQFVKTVFYVWACKKRTKMLFSIIFLNVILVLHRPLISLFLLDSTGMQINFPSRNPPLFFNWQTDRSVFFRGGQHHLTDSGKRMQI